MTEPLFFDGTPAAHDALTAAVAGVVDALATGYRPAPFSSADAETLTAAIDRLDPLPDDAVPLPTVLAEVAAEVLAHAARPTHPWCIAHLHSPTLISSAATELAIGVTNQSMDSYDQAPAATLVEDHLVRRLAAELGLPEAAGGVFTAGGTASNLLGLLLARDRASRTGDAPLGPTDTVGAAGLPREARRWRVLASTAAHASVRQAAAVLGLGRDAVVSVAVDPFGRMDLEALDAALGALTGQQLVPIAIVGTAGTTDAGAVDPIASLADRAEGVGAWLHVDAAVGSAFALSDRLRPLLDGLDRADSVTADLHKLWWQPIGASVLLVRDRSALAGLREPADYLNRSDDDGVLNLVDRSLDTSRRFDALKVLVSLRATGRRRLAELVERLVDLTADAGRQVGEHPELELLAEPQTVTVLFRCRPAGSAEDDLDGLNAAVQRALLGAGRAVVGRTRHHGRVALKLTVVNPLTTSGDVAALLDLVSAAARDTGRSGRPTDRPEGS